jgi:hypothetical protein
MEIKTDVVSRAEEDHMINPKTQHFMAERMGAKIHSHRLDHTPMYSEPNAVVDVIVEAARLTLGDEEATGRAASR